VRLSEEFSMADIVNLNRARKAMARAADRKTAEANRLTHGRTKAEREAARLERERAERLLDGSKRES
jgi:hypothetical protein